MQTFLLCSTLDPELLKPTLRELVIFIVIVNWNEYRFSNIGCFNSTGQRSIQGTLADLRNALVRYFSNNFSDGKRQDAMDLFLGHAKPNTIPIDQNDTTSQY